MILWRVCEYDINSFYNLFLGVAIFDMISRYDMDTTQNKQVSIWCDCIYVKKKKKNTCLPYQTRLIICQFMLTLQTQYTYKL